MLRPSKGASTKPAVRAGGRPEEDDLHQYEQTPFGWRKKRTSRKAKLGWVIGAAAAVAAGAWLFL